MKIEYEISSPKITLREAYKLGLMTIGRIFYICSSDAYTRILTISEAMPDIDTIIRCFTLDQDMHVIAIATPTESSLEKLALAAQKVPGNYWGVVAEESK